MSPLAPTASALSRPAGSTGAQRYSRPTPRELLQRRNAPLAPQTASRASARKNRKTTTRTLAAVSFDVNSDGGRSLQKQEQALSATSVLPLEAQRLDLPEGGEAAGEAVGEHHDHLEEEQEAEPPPPTLPSTPRLSLPLAAFALEAALWPELILSWASKKKTEFQAYLALSRPWNLFPSLLLVFSAAAAATIRGLGGASSTTSTPSLFLSLVSNRRVWHAALSTAAIALGSMVVNDYFDVAGDRVNAPTKPLPSGLVPVDGALLFGGSLYLATLVAAAWLEPRELRLLVSCSAAVTLAYTPLFKKVPVAKTAAVAGVISLSPLAGALSVVDAASQSKLALSVVAPACLLAFFAVSGRELLMDAADARGDGAAGVPTLPLLVGRRLTLVLAAALEGCAAAVLASRAFLAAASAPASRGLAASSSLIAASLWLGYKLFEPAAAAARAAMQAAALRKKTKNRNDDDASSSSSPSSSLQSLRKLSEAEAKVSAAIKRAVDGMMKPAGAAVIAAMFLG